MAEIADKSAEIADILAEYGDNLPEYADTLAEKAFISAKIVIFAKQSDDIMNRFKTFFFVLALGSMLTSVAAAVQGQSAGARTFITTLREMLNIPANVKGSIQMTKAFADQKALSGLSELYPLDIDRTLTIRIPASSVYVFDGTDENYDPTGLEDSEKRTENQSQTSNLKSQSYYDLQGRRVNPQSSMLKNGLYIVNGKLVKI